MDNKSFNKFYVLTGDLDFVVTHWCRSNQFKSPSQKGFENLRSLFRKDLEQVTAKTAEVTGRPLEVKFESRNKFPTLRKRENDHGFWIALDDVYIPKADFRIELTRIYDNYGERELGRGVRPETNPDNLKIQIDNCRKTYQKAGSPPSVVLADDGTFTGDTVIEILNKLREVGINVTELRMAFATFEGQVNIAKAIKRAGRRIIFEVGLSATKDSIFDWVCERDFFVGVPRSGRTVGTYDLDKVTPIPSTAPIVGFPYVKPWGPMTEGASISIGQKEFSARLTSYSIHLWQEIEKLNKITLKVRQLPRFPGPPKPTEDILNMPLIDYLETIEKWTFGNELKLRRKNERIFS